MFGFSIWFNEKIFREFRNIFQELSPPVVPIMFIQSYLLKYLTYWHGVGLESHLTFDLAIEVKVISQGQTKKQF